MLFSRITKKDLLIFVIVFLALGILFVLHKPSIILKDNYAVIENSTLPKLQVATSFPLAGDWIKAVGKDRVDIQIFPSPTDDALNAWLDKTSYDTNQETKVFFSMGSDIDQWAQELAGGSPKIKIDVDDLGRTATSTLSYVNLLKPSSNLAKNGVGYYWLSLDNAREAIGEIARELGKIDSINREYYINNAYEYSVELDSLLHESLDVLSSIRDERISLAGTQWAPLVENLRVHVIGAFDPQSVNDPKSAAALIKAVKLNKITTVISDPDSKNGPLGKILSETTASVAAIDPWGISSDNYVDFMRSNISELMRSL